MIQSFHFWVYTQRNWKQELKQIFCTHVHGSITHRSQKELRRRMEKQNVVHPYTGILLLLLLSHFSRVWLCATPEMATHQPPPSLGLSRQEHWSGLPFPSPMHESEKWNWSCSVMSDSSDPMDCSLPGSSVHGIFQARVLEWGAISFSNTGILFSPK